MAHDIALPELGENIDSGKVTAILVAVGDSVTADQPILELETDKAVVEVPCPDAGVIAEIRTKEGDTLTVGDVMIVLNGGGGTATSVAAQEKESSPESKAPELEAVVSEPTAEPAPEPVAIPEPTPAPKMDSPSQPKLNARAAPSVRKLAREIGVDINEVEPDSAGNRITHEDVKQHAKNLLTSSPAASAVRGTTTIAAVKLPNFEKYGPIQREEMSQVRKLTMASMTRSWTTIPHVTQHDKADITEMEKFRKERGKSVLAAGGKLTATAILVKVLAEALRKFPQFNASIDPENHEIIYKGYYNIGIAVDTPAGLIVPNIKDADQKSLVDISVEMAGMSERARERKTKLDELQGTSMTITNIGGIGGTSFTPIVNAPEVAILGVCRAKMEPVYIDDEFQPRLMMPISLSYDHRIIDGADAARFARWICQVLEQPLNLFL
ncbi:MAG: branched-chain alpha-keto acid dehydrogenase subunit E2 [Candidatus Hydrogenedentota bacterium]|nr:MAG: branched-chain alpha-keto acid dehydrogenase subunit E2 [Candidatus Hydrogenedentota bacterium]